MINAAKRAEQVAAGMKTIRPYAGDLFVGLTVAFLARQVPLWLGAEPTGPTWAGVAGLAGCLASYSLDWYDPDATTSPS